MRWIQLDKDGNITGSFATAQPGEGNWVSDDDPTYLTFLAHQSIPTTVQMWQAKAALMSAGLFDKADAAIHATNDSATIEAWVDGNEISITSPTVLAMATTLGLTHAQVVALFASAATFIR